MFCKLSTVIAPCEVTTKSGLDQNEIVLKTVKFAPFYEVIMDSDASNKRGQPQVPIAGIHLPDRSLRGFRRDPSRHSLKIAGQVEPNDLTTATSAPSSGPAILHPDFTSAELDQTPHRLLHDKQAAEKYDEDGFYQRHGLKTAPTPKPASRIAPTSANTQSKFGPTSSPNIPSMPSDEKLALSFHEDANVKISLVPSHQGFKDRPVRDMKTSFNTFAGGSGGQGKTSGGQAHFALGSSASGPPPTMTTLTNPYGYAASAPTPLLRANVSTTSGRTDMTTNAPILPFSLTRMEGAAGSSERWEPEWNTARSGVPLLVGQHHARGTDIIHGQEKTHAKSGSNYDFTNIADGLISADSGDERTYDDNGSEKEDNGAGHDGTHRRAGGDGDPMVVSLEMSQAVRSGYAGCIGPQWCSIQQCDVMEASTIRVKSSPVTRSSTGASPYDGNSTSNKSAKKTSSAQETKPPIVCDVNPAGGCLTSSISTGDDREHIAGGLTKSSSSSSIYIDASTETNNKGDVWKIENAIATMLPLEMTVPQEGYSIPPSPWLGSQVSGAGNPTGAATSFTTPGTGGQATAGSHDLVIKPSNGGNLNLPTRNLLQIDDELKHPAEEAFPQPPRVNNGLMFGLRTRNNELSEKKWGTTSSGISSMTHDESALGPWAASAGVNTTTTSLRSHFVNTNLGMGPPTPGSSEFPGAQNHISSLNNATAFDSGGSTLWDSDAVVDAGPLPADLLRQATRMTPQNRGLHSHFQCVQVRHRTSSSRSSSLQSQTTY